MNPANPFGSPQGGAFQAPNNAMKTGSFPLFGQQIPNNQPPQSVGFFQPSAFGQPSVNPPQHGNPLFGQGSAFGQPSTQQQQQQQQQQQPPVSQPPAFGMNTSGFGGGGSSGAPPPAFGQTTGSSQGSVFGQPTPAFGQTSAFGQAAGFAQQPPGFGKPPPPYGQQQQQQQQQQPSGFGSSQMMTSSGSNTTLGQPQPLSFGQSVFGQPASTSVPTSSVFGQPASTTVSTNSMFGQPASTTVSTNSMFGQPASTTVSTNSMFGQPASTTVPTSVFGQPASTSVPTSSVFGQPTSTTVSTTSVFGVASTQSRSFGTSEFSFKPANEALFKPIFSASPEPTNPQPTSNSPFGSSNAPQTSSTTMSSGSTTTGFPLLTGAKSGPLGFSFSQPAAAPSISTQSNPLTTGTSSGPSSTLQFTFSQPGAPSSSNTKASTTEPTTPSSFSFSAKTVQPQPASIFTGSNFVQPSAFGEAKANTEAGSDDKGSSLEGLGDTNIFARSSKGTKRKEDAVVPSSAPEKPLAEEDAPAETDLPRHPPKRPLMRSRGPPPGLFGRALSGLRRDVTPPARRDAAKESQLEEAEGEDVQTQDENLTAATPETQTLMREVMEKADEPDSAVVPEPQIENTTPEKRGTRRESMESLSGGSADCTTIQCRNIPQALNKKELIEKHFGRFGRVRKVFCRTAKNLAIVHFDDHASAAKAKKKGKMMHRQELLLLWQRKKQSPGDKGSRTAAEREEAEGEGQEDIASKAASSPLRRPPFRGAAVGSAMNFSRSSPVKKSSMVKSLQFDSELQKESREDTQSSERPVPSSLLPLIGQLADTAEDKYRLLEQRDKILRQGRPKRTDLDLSKVFVGTCPDMCPEKERYMRETRNQLSVFEVIANTEMVDHTTAIKEYSRSSADQEEPLPHDLRPLPVLSMTMDYLVTQIMDQGPDNYRDWYDFVWNRTRGIRKDIIQQRLCCPHTVSLIEKCTRFHVHCSHHLCEESLSTFDAKINNENMTKCLQSLKEMYEDLDTRQVYCAREAEFRQYSVLVKLNDGDILRDVQQFRDEVRNSPEVKFAVQAFAAVNSNNFVRFFKLVKGASYLASCLLHRYFNQVRAKALKALNVAHTVGPRSTAFPLDDIVRMLMFRTVDEATDFIQQYGLNVNDGVVELSRIAYQEPELPLSQKKSEVILSKKMMLVGEVVNGGSLPNPPQHAPVCSFDFQNKFRGEAPMALPSSSQSSQFKAIATKLEVKAPPSAELLTQVDVPAGFGLPPAVRDETGEPADSLHSAARPADSQQLFQPIAQPQPVKPPSPPPKPQYSDEDIMAVLDRVIEEVVEATVREVADAGASYTTTALSESSVQVESVVTEVLGQMLQEVSSSEIQLEQDHVVEEKRKLEEARRKQEHEAFLIQYSFSLCKELIYEVIDETIKEAATSEIQEAVDEKTERVAKCTEQVCTSLVEETLNADIALLVEEILDVELQRIHKYIKRWRDVVAVRRQLKRQMRGFPAAPCCVDPRFKLKALAPSAPARPSMADLALGLVNLGNSGTLALSSTRLLKMRQEVIHQLRVHYYYQQLLNESVWAPLDLSALVTENIPDPPERIFWKAVLLLPSDDESVASLADRILSDWLEVKLGGGKKSEVMEEEKQPDGTLQTLCVINALQETEQHVHKVHVSIKASRGPLIEDSLSKMEECCDLQGTGALIMLLPAPRAAESEQEEQDVPLLSARLQLRQLQQASTWHSPLPLVILVPGPDSDTQKLEEDLMLDTLVKEGLISEYTFLFIPETTSDLQGSKQLSHAMQWLLARAPPPFPLSCQTLVQLVEASLSREFSQRVQAHRQERAAACLPSQDPAPVIQLYNAVLDHIADRVTSQDLSRLSWPPGEFCLPDTRDFVPHLGWNSASHMDWLQKAILSLKLPQWSKVSNTDSYSELCSSVFHYAAQIPVSRNSQPLIMSRLENLLERVRLKGRRSRTPRSKVTAGSWGDGDQSSCQIPWDDVLVICIDHKLKDWQVPGPPVCEDAVTEDGEILVYFLTESLKGFQPPEGWTEAVRQTHREKQQENKGASAAASATPTGLSLRQRLFSNPLEHFKALTVPLDVSHTPTAEELLAHKVLRNLEEEKAESKRSMEQLQRWLDGDAFDHLSTPLFIPSSTLLSMPTIISHAPAAKTRDAALTEESESDELSEKADWPKTAPVSMAWRLKELEQQILASQEEELACRLKLNGLLSIVDD